MEFTKDNFLDTDKFKNILEGKEEKKQNRIVSFIKNHKIISGVIIFSSACMIINAIMVFSFFSILRSII